MLTIAVAIVYCDIGTYQLASPIGLHHRTVGHKLLIPLLTSLLYHRATSQWACIGIVKEPIMEILIWLHFTGYSRI